MDEKQLSNATLAGQRLVIGFDGTAFSPELERRMEELKIGGVILFSGNIETPVQLKELCVAIQRKARSLDLPPPFIAIDQEGGMVARLKPPFTVFPGSPAMKCAMDAGLFADITSSELSRVGVNMNMAPVVDVAPEGFESVMEGRMFGKDPAWTAELGTAVVERLQKGGVMAVAKHFPGIGRTTLDSHLDLPVSDIEPDDLRGFDLIPFRAAIEKQVAGVMLSHVTYEKLDDQWPASLSTTISRDLLRKELGFQGLAITDDLDMGAIEKHFDIETCIGRIFEADIDIALICHPSPKIDEAFEALLRAVESGQESRKKAEQSIARILDCKRRFL